MGEKRSVYITNLRDKLKHFISNKIVKPAEKRMLPAFFGKDERYQEIIDELGDEIVCEFMVNPPFMEDFDGSENVTNSSSEVVVRDDFDEDIVKLIDSSIKTAFDANISKMADSISKRINITKVEMEADRRSGYLIKENEKLKEYLAQARYNEEYAKYNLDEARDTICDLNDEIEALKKRLAQYEPHTNTLAVIPDDEIKKCSIDYKRFEKDDLKRFDEFIVLRYAKRNLELCKDKIFVEILVPESNVKPFVMLAGGILAKLVKEQIDGGRQFKVKITDRKVIRKNVSTNYCLGVEFGHHF